MNRTGARRSATKVNAALAGAHSAYEVAAGVGMPAQDLLGLAGATALHAVALARWAGAAPGRRPHGPGTAVLDGVGLGGAVTHFVAWPRRRWHGLPVLAPGA